MEINQNIKMNTEEEKVLCEGCKQSTHECKQTSTRFPKLNFNINHTKKRKLSLKKKRKRRKSIMNGVKSTLNLLAVGVVLFNFGSSLWQPIVVNQLSSLLPYL